MEACALITSTGNKQNITQNSSLMSGKSNVAADTIVNTAFQSYKKQAGVNTVLQFIINLSNSLLCISSQLHTKSSYTCSKAGNCAIITEWQNCIFFTAVTDSKTRWAMFSKSLLWPFNCSFCERRNTPTLQYWYQTCD